MNSNLEKQPLVSKSGKQKAAVNHRWSAVVLARAVSCVSAIGSGYEGGCFGAIAPDIKIHFGLSESSMGLLASVPVIILAVASFLGGMLANMIGRKPALAITFVMLIVGSLLQAFAASLTMFAIGRSVVCAGCGAGASIVTIYGTEVTPASYRGLFVSLEDFFINAGILLAFAAVWFFMDSSSSWRLTVGVGAVLPASALLLLILPQVPESPRYFYMRGRLEEAKQAMRRLVDDEDEIQRTFIAWESDAPRPLMEALRQTPRRALLAAIGLGMCSTMGGVHAINGLLNYVLTQVMQSNEIGHGARHIAADWAVHIVLGKALVLLPVCLLLMDKVGRRPLLLCSAGFMAAGALVTTLALAMSLPDAVTGLGITILLCSFSIGLGPVPFVYCSEALPTEVRGPGFGFMLLVSRLLASAQLFILPSMLKYSACLPFAIYFVINIGIGSFVYACCPETAGRKLEDMPAVFE